MLNLEQLSKICLEDKDIAAKLKLIAKEGFTLSAFEEVKNIYVGKPIGFTTIDVVNFKNATETRQICLYKNKGKYTFYQGSLKKLIRSSKALQSKNKTFAYNAFAPILIETLAKYTPVVDGQNLHQLFFAKSSSHRKNDILKAINIILDKVPTTLVQMRDEETSIKLLILHEINGSLNKSGHIYGGYEDRVIYVRNMLANAVNFEIEKIINTNDITAFRKFVASLPNENIASVLSLCKIQKELISFIARLGNSQDLQKVILTPPGYTLNIASCDALLSAVIENNYSTANQFTYKKIAPVYATLFNATSIGKGFKKRLSAYISKYLVSVENPDTGKIIKALSLDIDAKQKPIVLEKYLEALIENNLDTVQKIESKYF